MQEIEYDSLNKHLLPDRFWVDVTSYLPPVHAHLKSRFEAGYSSSAYKLSYNRLRIYQRRIDGRTYVPKSYWDFSTEFIRSQNTSAALFQARSPELYAAVTATNLPQISGAVVGEHLDRSIQGSIEVQQ